MKVDVSGTGLALSRETELIKIENEWLKKLKSSRSGYIGSEMTGWVDLPEKFDEDILCDIQETALRIKDKCTLFIVCGIGGSYLGAKAVIDAMGKSNSDWPEVVFAGFNMSAAYLSRLVKRIANESVCLCAISKSGNTTEPMLSYSILREKIFEKYGIEEARNRIYIITDKENGLLRKDALENGFKSFIVPDNIGGRYSVLTPVGLLPIAVSGYDIEMLIKGASDMSADRQKSEEYMNYALSRVLLQKSGKNIEIFEYFENDLRYFGEWLKQLFGESEGKNGKGAYPACLSFSRDLHSIGQFLQQGNQIFYETMIIVNEFKNDFIIPDFIGEPYAGKSLEEINECSENGVLIAHKNAGIPVITIEVPILDEYNVGQMIYFFEMSAALSAYMLNVNPFDQPGVEEYKREMKNLAKSTSKVDRNMKRLAGNMGAAALRSVGRSIANEVLGDYGKTTIGKSVKSVVSSAGTTIGRDIGKAIWDDIKDEDK